MSRASRHAAEALSRLRLWRCRSVGRGCSVTGRVWVHGGGEVRLGERVQIDARQAPVELHVAAGATLVIGDDVFVGPGTVIETQRSVRIGTGSRLDGFVRIIDNHLHSLRGDRRSLPRSAPVTIGDGVRLGWRSIVLPGAQLRDGQQIPPAGILRGPPLPAELGSRS